MSFGWSAGDIFSAITILYKVGEALYNLPNDSKIYHQTSRFLESTRINLNLLGKIVEDHESGRIPMKDDGQVREIEAICANIKPSVDELTDKLAEHCGLDKKAKGRHWPQQQLGKLKWKFADEESVGKLVEDIHRQACSVQAFLQLQTTSTLSSIEATTIYIKHRMENLEQCMLASSAGPPFTLSPSTVCSPSPSSPSPSITAQTALQYLLEHESHSLGGRFSQSPRPLRADAVLMEKIRAWLSGRAPPRLWLHGTTHTTVGSEFFDVGRKKNARIVAYSCRHQRNGMIIDHEARLVGLVYAFLSQLLSQMPEGIAIPEKIKNRGWDTLDGRMSTVEVAIGFLRVLVEMLPKCMAVIEGFQYLCDSMDGKVDKLLRELVELFGQVNGDQGEALGTRLLCLTQGNAQMLMGYHRDYVTDLGLERHVNKSGEIFTQALLRAEW